MAKYRLETIETIKTMQTMVRNLTVVQYMWLLCTRICYLLCVNTVKNFLVELFSNLVFSKELKSFVKTGMRKKVSLGRSEIDVYVEKGDLKLNKSDVIVCATSQELDLSKGRVAREILQAAGNQVQLDCDVYYPAGIRSTEIAVVDAGNLQCHKLVFVALRPWGRGNSLQELEVVVNKCLDAASEGGYESIAFPALGTGLLRYPVEEVAQTTFQCVEDFSNSINNTTLKAVNIIIYHADDRIYSEFVREAKVRAPSSLCDEGAVACEYVPASNSDSPYIPSLTAETRLCRTQTTSHRYTPRYWLSDDTVPVGTYRVPVDRKTFHDVEAVVTATWLGQYVGHGRDGVGLSSYSNIKVTKVERIQNVHLFSNYARRRQILRRKARSGSSFDVLENIPGSGEKCVMTMDSMDEGSVLGTDIFPEVNEIYLFHGTLKDKIESIAERGLQLGSEMSMFGKGVYAAESSTKADQYADPKQSRDIKGEKQMFLIRACLGRIYLATSARKFAGMPCTAECEDQCNCEESSICDSVVANGYWNFREFVVFDSCQVYPEYLITYKRI